MSTSMTSGMSSGEHTTSTAWVTMLTVPPRFTPGAWSALTHMDRDAHADLGAFAQPHEIDMHRQVLHRIELEVARDDAMLGSPSTSSS